MPHFAIVGMTESGKSSLARKLAAEIATKGMGVIVFDPLDSPEWVECLEGFENVQIVNDEETMLRLYWSSYNCAVFFDEAGDYAHNGAREFIRTATKGRHQGHSNFYIAQRGNMLARTIRDQCTAVYMFTSSRDDAKIYASEFNEPVLIDACTLPQGSYYKCGRYTKLEKIVLFKGKGK